MSKSQRKSKSNRPSSSQMNESLTASVGRKKKLQSLLTKGVLLNENAENQECSNILLQVKSLINHSNAISKENADSTNPQNANAITNASENVMDAAVIKIGHEIVGTVANKLGHSEFTEAVHAENVLSQIREGGQINWESYGEKIFHMIKRPRFSHSFLGTFDCQADPVVKPKKERVVRRKAEMAELKRPEKVVTLQKEEKGAQLLAQVKEQIENEYVRRGQTPFPYYELILDRDDFMHTVDNAFHVAFLVRDGMVGLACNENDDPIVFVPTKAQKKIKEQDKATKQAVVGLNYGKWVEAKERYEQNEPILKLDRSDLLQISQASQSQRQRLTQH